MSTRTYDGPPLYDPATYAHGFPYDIFRNLRADDPVPHHDHPPWDRGSRAPPRPAARCGPPPPPRGGAAPGGCPATPTCNACRGTGTASRTRPIPSSPT